MRLLFDTNVVLDVLLDRAPFSAPAAELFSKVETGAISGYICATTITTVHYLAMKVVGTRQAEKEISKLLALFEVAPVNRPVLEAALAGKLPDFEDAVVCEAARQVGAQGVVTRDVRDFKRSSLPVYTPTEMLQTIKSKE